MDLGELTGLYPMVFPIPAEATILNDDEWAAFVAPFKCKLARLSFVPEASIVAAAAAFSLSLRNRTTGAGALLAATRTWTAVNSTAWTSEDFPLSGTPANLEFAAGDALTVVRTHITTGLASPRATLIAYLLPRR
jgi:hypothetical protein